MLSKLSVTVSQLDSISPSGRSSWDSSGLEARRKRFAIAAHSKGQYSCHAKEPLEIEWRQRNAHEPEGGRTHVAWTHVWDYRLRHAGRVGIYRSRSRAVLLRRLFWECGLLEKAGWKATKSFPEGRGVCVGWVGMWMRGGRMKKSLGRTLRLGPRLCPLCAAPALRSFPFLQPACPRAKKTKVSTVTCRTPARAASTRPLFAPCSLAAPVRHPGPGWVRPSITANLSKQAKAVQGLSSFHRAFFNSFGRRLQVPASFLSCHMSAPTGSQQPGRGRGRPGRGGGSRGGPGRGRGGGRRGQFGGSLTVSAGNQSNAPETSSTMVAEKEKETEPTASEGAETSTAAEEGAPALPEVDLCFICAEPVKLYSVASCNHRTCHICAIRLRALYKKTECTFCKVSGLMMVLHARKGGKRAGAPR